MKKSIFYYVLTLFYIGLVTFSFVMLHRVLNSLVLVLFIAIYYFNINIALIILFQKRDLSIKFTWMIVMISLPFFGHIVFLLFGQIYFTRQDIKTYHKRKTFHYEVLKPSSNRFLQEQSHVSKRGVYNANFSFFEDGNDAFDDLFTAIKNAKKYIHMHWYIIKPGEIYDHWKTLIIAKAKQGVVIRLIVDDFGSWSIPKSEIKELKRHGIQMQVFSKIVFPFVNAMNFYRTHRKVVIIDSEVVYLGGINIGDEYASLSHWYGRWLDLQVKITGGAIRSHVLLFIEDWKHMRGEWLDPQQYIDVPDEGDNKTVLVEDSPEISQNIGHDSLLNLIYNARQEIIIATPYFVPSQAIIDALKMAASKGVAVKIFVPGLHDKRIALYTSYYYVYSLLDANIKFYKTISTFLHTKAGIFDGKICYFGTMNLDRRSFYSQLEFINLFVGPAAKQIALIFKNYEKIAVRIEKQPRFWKYQKSAFRFFVIIFSPLI